MVKLTPHLIQQCKNQRRLTMVTCYEALAARLVNQSEVDLILVGDSVAMVVHGYPSTIHATMSMMELHVAAVRRGSEDKFIVADLPFLVQRLDKYQAVIEAGKLMQAGADAIKIEGVNGHEGVIQYIVESGIPVMGHIGLTPQTIASLGGWKVQGKDQASAEALLTQAKDLEALGCFALVVECVPALLGQEITQSLTIPTIGIGAGAATDGQVLVWHDLLGLNPVFKPKFVRRFAHLDTLAVAALNQYHQAVAAQAFPSEGECY